MTSRRGTRNEHPNGTVATTEKIAHLAAMPFSSCGLSLRRAISLERGEECTEKSKHLSQGLIGSIRRRSQSFQL